MDSPTTQNQPKSIQLIHKLIKQGQPRLTTKQIQDIISSKVAFKTLDLIQQRERLKPFPIHKASQLNQYSHRTTELHPSMMQIHNIYQKNSLPNSIDLEKSHDLAADIISAGSVHWKRQTNLSVRKHYVLDESKNLVSLITPRKFPRNHEDNYTEQASKKSLQSLINFAESTADSFERMSLGTKNNIQFIQPTDINSSSRAKRPRSPSLQLNSVSSSVTPYPFSSLKPLNQLWISYSINLLEKAIGNHVSKISHMDFHGAIIKIVESIHPSHIGIQGIILVDSKDTFTLCLPDNRLFRIGKKDIVFSISIKDIVFTLFGPEFQVRVGRRTKKKFKIIPFRELSRT